MLTVMKIQKIKAQEADLMILDSNNLYLRVRPNGSKSWIIRFMLNGKAKKKTIGKFPDMSLQEARIKRDSMLDRMKKGESEPSKETFGDFFLKILDIKSKSLSATTINNNRYLFNKWLKNPIGNIEMAKLSRKILINVVNDVADKGSPGIGIIVAKKISETFKIAMNRGVLDTNPAHSLTSVLSDRKYITEHRKAVFLKSEIRELLLALESISPDYDKDLIKIIAYTFLRKGEAIKAKWEDIDLERRIWTIPKGNTKMRRDFIVPISKQVYEILSKFKTDKRSDFVFIKPGRAVNTLKSIIATDIKNVYPKVHIHGFRSIASSILNEAGWNPDAIERQLSHAPSGVRSVYNRAQYLEERIAMMQWYADCLDAIKRGEEIPKKEFSPSHMI